LSGSPVAVWWAPDRQKFITDLADVRVALETLAAKAIATPPSRPRRQREC
jgi:hypothetical protein